jgi:SAM-dependent methyltransferase
MTGNRWLQMIAENPGHSAWYIERFRSMAAEGADLGGEARFVDTLVPRQARILDAGCGPGRVGGHLARLGHTVVGVDIDPALIAAAQADHPGPTWLTADLATLDLPSIGITDPFDAIVCAGNVMTFLDPETRTEAVARLAAHLAPDGRIAVGFGSGRGYELDELLSDAEIAGLHAELMLASWDLRPFSDESEFLVAVLASRGSGCVTST